MSVPSDLNAAIMSAAPALICHPLDVPAHRDHCTARRRGPPERRLLGDRLARAFDQPVAGSFAHNGTRPHFSAQRAYGFIAVKPLHDHRHDVARRDVQRRTAGIEQHLPGREVARELFVRTSLAYRPHTTPVDHEQPGADRRASGQTYRVTCTRTVVISSAESN
jgi:hypothetical protein